MLVFIILPIFLVVAGIYFSFKETIHFFLIINRPAQDPADFTKSMSSTNWDKDYFCPKCYSSMTLSDSLNHFCNRCGETFRYSTHRLVRKIWNGKKWIKQYRYDDPKYLNGETWALDE